MKLIEIKPETHKYYLTHIYRDGNIEYQVPFDRKNCIRVVGVKDLTTGAVNYYDLGCPELNKLMNFLTLGET